MNLTVLWRAQAADAVAELARHDPNTARRIHQRVVTFAGTGQGDVKKLAGPDDRWRLRIGSWHVIFAFDPPGTLTVLTVQDRRDAYR